MLAVKGTREKEAFQRTMQADVLWGEADGRAVCGFLSRRKHGQERKLTFTATSRNRFLLSWMAVLKNKCSQDLYGLGNAEARKCIPCVCVHGWTRLFC